MERGAGRGPLALSSSPGLPGTARGSRPDPQPGPGPRGSGGLTPTRGQSEAGCGIAPEAYFAGHGEWADPDGRSDGRRGHLVRLRHRPAARHEKPAAYGQSGIPLHLLIDRDSCTIAVHSSPDRKAGGYRDIRTAKFGEKVLLPDPVGIELDTEILKNYVR